MTGRELNAATADATNTFMFIINNLRVYSFI
jgi:hypothetical protein